MSVQKKVLTKLGTKSTVKILIDDNLSGVLDHVYHLCKDYTQSKSKAEKLTKNIIKVAIKIGLLFRNNQFNQEELMIFENFRKKFRATIMTFVSYYEVDFTFDKNYLSKSVNDCCALLQQLVVRHLTDKSLTRIEFVFKFFSDDALLETLFERDCPLTKHLDGIVNGLNKLIENGDI